MPDGLTRRRLGIGGALAVVVLLVIVLGSTCSAPAARTLPPPSSTSSTDPEPTTTSIDWSQVPLGTVAGVTTTTITDTGDAILSGVVTGPDGNVPGATIRIQRLVGDAVQTKDVQAGPDGTWVIEGLPGGRFRVRAFLPPTLTMLDAEIFFLPDGETRDLRLPVTAHQGIDVKADAAPSSPMVGDAVNLAVRVAEKVVDGDGIARTQPLAGIAVELRSSGWSRPAAPRTTTTTLVGGDDVDDGGGTASGDVEVTDSDGVALFELFCDRATTVTATVVIGTGPDEQPFPLEVPSCGARPTTTTTEPDDDDDETTTSGVVTTTTSGDDETTTTEDG